MSLAAHAWTVWPILREKWQPETAPSSKPWSIEVPDPTHDTVRLTGALSHRPGSNELLILVHGLASCSEARYVLRAARAADERGISTLRLSMRGCDRSGEDLYHAGLSSDLAAVMASPEVTAFERVYMLGFSLGGHMTLKMATELDDRRLKAVAAVCPPLDLEPTVVAFDKPQTKIYRRYILRHLFDIYTAIERRERAPTPLAEVQKVKLLRDFDRLTVVRRFGFKNAADYYSRSSVGPRLGELKSPALLLAAEHDPMVVSDGIRPALVNASDRLEVRWSERGGHVGFPDDLDLGFKGSKGLERQILTWLQFQ